jgi:putative sterol carrier protein
MGSGIVPLRDPAVAGVAAAQLCGGYAGHLTGLPPSRLPALPPFRHPAYTDSSPALSSLVTEPLPVFSDDWARACADVLNQRLGYRAAAATWEGAILLMMTAIGPDQGERRVFLDLWHGDCRAARAADPADEAAARYVLSGTVIAWRQVLTGTQAPLIAIMTGKLRLTKGSLVELIPYVNAAKELVAAAALVQATFPDGP